MLSTVDRRPSPVDHTQRPALCTARWGLGVTQRVARSVGVKQDFACITLCFPIMNHTNRNSTKLCIYPQTQIVWAIIAYAFLLSHSKILTSLSLKKRLYTHPGELDCHFFDLLNFCLRQSFDSTQLLLCRHLNALQLEQTQTNMNDLLQSFNVPLSQTTWVSQYQKKHSDTYTYCDHQPSLISILHLLRCTHSILPVQFTCLTVLVHKLSSFRVHDLL